MMIKLLLVSVVLLGNCFRSAQAFPAVSKDTNIDDQAAEKRAPFKFGTALGHKSSKNDADDFNSEWWKTYNNLYGGKRDFKFGTALGHGTKTKVDNFDNAWNEAFKNLYPGAGKRGIAYGTALGHSARNRDRQNFADQLEAKFKELYGK